MRFLSIFSNKPKSLEIVHQTHDETKATDNKVGSIDLKASRVEGIGFAKGFTPVGGRFEAPESLVDGEFVEVLSKPVLVVFDESQLTKDQYIVSVKLDMIVQYLAKHAQGFGEDEEARVKELVERKIERLEAIYQKVNENKGLLDLLEPEVADLVRKDPAVVTDQEVVKTQDSIRSAERRPQRNERMRLLASTNSFMQELLVPRIDGDAPVLTEKVDAIGRVIFVAEGVEFGRATEKKAEPLSVAELIDLEFEQLDLEEAKEKRLVLKKKEEERIAAVREKLANSPLTKQQRRAQRMRIIARSNPFAKGLIDGGVLVRTSGGRYRLGDDDSARGTLPAGE